MKKTLLSLSLAFAFSQHGGCLAADNAALNNVEKDASDAMRFVGKEVDMAEHAITTEMKGAGKASSSTDTKVQSNHHGSDTSLGDSMNELGKSANKAGIAIGNSINNMGKQAGAQIQKSQNELKSNQEKHASQHANSAQK